MCKQSLESDGNDYEVRALTEASLQDVAEFGNRQDLRLLVDEVLRLRRVVEDVTKAVFLTEEEFNNHLMKVLTIVGTKRSKKQNKKRSKKRKR